MWDSFTAEDIEFIDKHRDSVLKIFIYADLKKDCPYNFEYLRNSLFVGEDITVEEYSIYNVGLYCMSCLGDSKYKVVGEVYEVSPETFIYTSKFFKGMPPNKINLEREGEVFCFMQDIYMKSGILSPNSKGVLSVERS